MKHMTLSDYIRCAIIAAALILFFSSLISIIERTKYYHDSNELIQEMRETDKEHARLNAEYGKDLDERKNLTEEYRVFLKGIGATE
ncbi:hypothetical protein B2I21_08820 [Chryseobacterium mucoviscidosis]|nr:hypothetical protein B2I21_08820 [Chryseobacterium mucoviscidosis]